MNRTVIILSLLVSFSGCKSDEPPAVVPAETTNAPVAAATNGAAADAHHHHHHEVPPAADVDLGSSLYQLDVQFNAQDGKPRAWDDFRGEPLVISMVYTTCTTACPLIVSEIKQILKAAGTESLRVLLVSMDPERDTPTALAEMKTTHSLGDNWTLVQPGADDVAEVAAALGIRYRQLPTKDFNHSQVITLLDSSGAIQARAEGLGPQRDAIVEALANGP